MATTRLIKSKLYIEPHNNYQMASKMQKNYIDMFSIAYRKKFEFKFKFGLNFSRPNHIILELNIENEIKIVPNFNMKYHMLMLCVE
jgi:hypothetical protein